MFQAFALICMLNGECAVVSDGIQITDRSLCDKFHLATLTEDLSANTAFLRLASKSSFINFGCIDVSSIPQDELANYVIDLCERVTMVSAPGRLMPRMSEGQRSN